MTKELFFWCFLIGLLGVAFQVLIKIKQLKARAISGNAAFSINSYFVDDWPTIAISLVVLVAALIASNEIIGWKPQVLPYLKGFFFFIGYTGSSLLNAFLSKAEKKIMSTIDEKTDIADNVTKQ